MQAARTLLRFACLCVVGLVACVTLIVVGMGFDSGWNWVGAALAVAWCFVFLPALHFCATGRTGTRFFKAWIVGVGAIVVSISTIGDIRDLKSCDSPTSVYSCTASQRLVKRLFHTSGTTAGQP